jgi:phosphate transport system permease protein
LPPSDSQTLIAGPEVGTGQPEPEELRVAHLGDRLWAAGLTAIGGGVLAAAGLVFVVLTRTAAPAVSQIGAWHFVSGQDWDPVSGQFGALSFIYGTLVTSVLAIVVALPVSVGLALFLAEMGPPALRRPVAFAVETLAAIPSVVYGLWGLFVLVPVLRNPVEPFLGRWLGFLPLFKGPPIGLGYLAAGLILAIMILPTIASVTLDVLRTVPAALKEGALALGATRWETIRLTVLPYARPGIAGAALLGLGRALGETMAVAMVIGNAPEIRASLFAPGYTLPAVLANEFSEATSATHVGALAGLGLVLFGITVALNAVARLLLVLTTRRVSRVRA